MIESIKEYLEDIRDISPQSGEYEKRRALENLLRAFAPNGVEVKHEPNRDKSEEKAGAPDFWILQNSLSLGYVENKRVGADLDRVATGKQIAKYFILSKNILLTDYLRFCLIRPDERGNASIVREAGLCDLKQLALIGKNLEKSLIVPTLEENAKNVQELFKLFFSYPLKPIVRAIEFANHLTVRTRIVRDKLKEKEKNNNISNIYNAFKESLYKELEFEEFCDSFAQTLTFSLFLAKLNNKDSQNMDLYNVKKFIPYSFPLIRSMSGFLDNLDDLADIRWALGEIIGIVNHIDIVSIIKELNKISQKDIFGNFLHKDPYLHFYETFLKQYDPDLRKLKGVYYTPAAVVDFIINAIDDVLKNDFNKLDGLSDALKKDSAITLLDFATGTGTFLLEAFRKALNDIDKNSTDLNNISRLIDRFMGFEFLVAPYTVAHLKLSQTLKEEFGYEVGKNKIIDKEEKEDYERLKIFLTNTLVNFDKAELEKLQYKEYELAKESSLAQSNKNEDILIITGNPPYNGSSKNTYEGISVYYDFGKDKNGKPIKEKNSKPLQDDYVKFIRFAESKIENQENGIIGIITNHSFLDNPTFRAMRKHLLSSFNKMYLLDLHGNTKKKEKSPDGSKDQNVFDIQQGVSISIFVKTHKKETDGLKCEVYHYDLFGDRKSKYDFLLTNHLRSIHWQSLVPQDPFYLFIPQNNQLREEYNKGWSVKDIFRLSSVGIVTSKDSVFIGLNSRTLEAQVRGSYKEFDSDLVKDIAYRPFDIRKIYYDFSKIGRPRKEVMEHFLQDKNKAFSNLNNNKKHLFEDDVCFESDPFDGKERIENFTSDFRAFIDEKYGENFTPEVILGYIYAILFHKDYREKYLDFLKMDFPKIPFSDSKEKFLKLSNFGQKLIALHLGGGGGGGKKLFPNGPKNQKFKGGGQCGGEKKIVGFFVLGGGVNKGRGNFSPFTLKKTSKPLTLAKKILNKNIV
ncbi:type ISP restriction/modification enzyme, partial [Helicobacter sp. 11S03491-1]|uniref:type ISP restriction/modification enzyme n=1 Tax=Helicobacter sp. 11S03491-1 TaxID=1476196 RepID=UPI000BA5BE08